MPSTTSDPQGQLARRLGVFDAVVVGLGAMLGAGVFAVWAPAAGAAGTAAGLLAGLAIAAFVAYANAASSARLAALYPESGGTYVYGTRRLGGFWGYLAGWAFIVGKTASCAAMALTVGAYLAPTYARWIGAAAVIVLTAVNYRGVQKSAILTRILVAITLVVLVFFIASSGFTGQFFSYDGKLSFDLGSYYGMLQASGLLFFAFAGYARIATLGEEVRDPRRTIPRAIPIALGIVLVVYVLVGWAVLGALGPQRLAQSTAPIADAVRAGGFESWVPLAQVGAAIAALGSLLALILGVSRTSFAMARDNHLPGTLSSVHPKFQVPHHAELLVGVVVTAVVLTVDLRGAIGFSSFGVLLYYAIANASALTLDNGSLWSLRILPALGLAGCLVLAFTLPWPSVIVGACVLAIGAGIYAVRTHSKPT